MSTTLKTAVANYLRSGSPARGTRAEYQTTLRKWKEWGGRVPIERLGRKEIREFLDWVYERAVTEEGKSRSNGEQSSRATPGGRFMGLGPGIDRGSAPISKAAAAARCGWTALFDQSRNQRPVLRDA